MHPGCLFNQLNYPICVITKLKKSFVLTTGNGCSNLKQVETTIPKWLNDMKTVTKQNSGNKPINSHYN